jgi:polysaccharide pyruvyl transferase WcaK-like protein
VLRDAGWDGKSTVLAVCPINPFWWPVKPSLAKWAAHSAFGAYKNSHYRTMYFHRSGADVDAAYEKYLTAIADGVRPYSKERNAFVVFVGMEMLDRDACEKVSAKLGGCPVFSSDRYNMYELVSILRGADRILSSRFHAIVTSMPGGVPSAGVTMDERIRNLMKERQHEHLLMRVDEPDLSDRIVVALRALDQQQDEIRDTVAATVARNIRLMARMGMYLEEQVARRFPEFPLRAGLRGWEEYLPPLSSQLRGLLETQSGVLTA